MQREVPFNLKREAPSERIRLNFDQPPTFNFLLDFLIASSAA